MQDEPLIYFQPNQMAYVVTHGETDSLNPKLIGPLVVWSNNQAKELFPDKHVVIDPPPPDRQFSFPTKGLTAHKPSDELPRLESEKNIRPEIAMPAPFTILFMNVSGVDSKDLVKLASGLDGKRESLKLEGAALQLVSLNWLTSAGNGQVGSGGPGGKPEKYIRQGNSDPYHFKLPSALAKEIAEDYKKRGEGVEVAILDTAPYLHDVADAYHRWGEHGDHLLIKSLLKSVNTPDARLQIHYAPYDTLSRLASYELNQHRYKMTDHGLFVAGIIHAIAPCAKLHLIEVLNPYGVGDVESIAWGLNQVVQMVKDSQAKNSRVKWVVNCSLVLNAPTEMKQLMKIADLQEPLIQVLGEDDNRLMDWMKRQGRSIELISDLLDNLRTKVIAAAGNDREKQPGSPRPGPRYPAVSNSVLGVGALPKNAISQGLRLNTASYSNKADIPGYIGLTTLGGEEGKDNNGQEQGILGLYIGEFPSKSKSAGGCAWWFFPPILSAFLSLLRKPQAESENTNGWAWWCGTSFATPIISGVTAAVLGLPSTLPTTREAVDRLYTAQAIVTVDNEDVLQVEQGFTPSP